MSSEFISRGYDQYETIWDEELEVQVPVTADGADEPDLCSMLKDPIEDLVRIRDVHGEATIGMLCPKAS